MKVRIQPLVFFLCSLWLAPKVESQERVDSFVEAKLLASTQLAAEALTVPLYLDPSRIRMEVVEERLPVVVAQDVRLLQVKVTSIDHWHSYRLAQVRGQILRLGGFNGPDVPRLAEALTALPLLERSRLIALALDEGSHEPILAADTLRNSTKLGIPASHQVRWPPDTVVRLVGGETLVRVTTVESQRAAYGPFSRLRQLALIFDVKDSLAAWYVRVGEPFPQRQSETRP